MSDEYWWQFNDPRREERIHQKTQALRDRGRDKEEAHLKSEQEHRRQALASLFHEARSLGINPEDYGFVGDIGNVSIHDVRRIKLQDAIYDAKEKGKQQGIPSQAEGRYPPQVLFQDTYKGWETYPGCVPASISHILGYWGHDKPIEEVQKGVFSIPLIKEGWRGTVTGMAQHYLRGLGYEVTTKRKTTADDVKKELDAGRPVMVHTNSANKPWMNHMSVVHGYDENGFFLRNEAEPYMSYDAFDKIWSAPWALWRQHEAIFVSPTDKVHMPQKIHPVATRTTPEMEMPHGQLAGQPAQGWGGWTKPEMI